MFDTTTFTGTLSGHGHSEPVVFTAAVDEFGVLSVRLGRMPFSAGAHSLLRYPEPTEPLDRITLAGTAADGTTFFSDTFSILRSSHSALEGQELDYQGECAVADIARVAAEPKDRTSKVWLLRKFGSFHRIRHDVPMGAMWIGGMDESAESQKPNGFMHLIHPTGLADQAWLDRSERMLVHVARVMSFACGTYLSPVVERLFHGEVDRLRVVRRARAVAPKFAPFTPFHLEPIFAVACDTFETGVEAVAAIDAAIRWLAMPVPSWESELVNAMTALENLLEIELPAASRQFQNTSRFKKTASKLRERMRELGADEGMLEKVPELNRRSFSEKLDLLLDAMGIVTDDLPDDWRRRMISTRNNIIHTGVLPVDLVTGPGVPGHVIWAREIATRLILHILGFEGGYQSWLHRDQTLHFPSCRRVGATAQG